jgi:uncharacterized protein (DUF1778 family)
MVRRKTEILVRVTPAEKDAIQQAVAWLNDHKSEFDDEVSMSSFVRDAIADRVKQVRRQQQKKGQD